MCRLSRYVEERGRETERESKVERVVIIKKVR